MSSTNEIRFCYNDDALKALDRSWTSFIRKTKYLKTKFQYYVNNYNYNGSYDEFKKIIDTLIDINKDLLGYIKNEEIDNSIDLHSLRIGFLESIILIINNCHQLDKNFYETIITNLKILDLDYNKQFYDCALARTFNNLRSHVNDRTVSLREGRVFIDYDGLDLMVESSGEPNKSVQTKLDSNIDAIKAKASSLANLKCIKNAENHFTRINNIFCACNTFAKKNKNINLNLLNYKDKVVGTRVLPIDADNIKTLKIDFLSSLLEIPYTIASYNNTPEIVDILSDINEDNNELFKNIK